MGSRDIERLVKPHLLNVQTYDPVDPPELLAQQAGVPLERVVKLNGNENPYGGSPKAAEALARAPIHIYPDPLQRRIREALAGYTGMEPDYIVAGAGSDELIDLLFRLFISPGDRVLDFDPTFGMYGFCARVAGAQVVLVPRDDSFEIDVEAARKAMDDGVKVVFVSSPNNPTGNLVSRRQVLELLDTGRIVVIDEAYYEFAGQTVTDLVPEHENLVVLRTLSKWAGLAGLRIGYGVMSPRLVRYIMDIKPPYNVNVAAEAALLASLEDLDYLMGNVRRIIQERERLLRLLEGVPGVRTWPSAGNFVLCQVAQGRGQEVFEGLARRGVFVRNFRTARLRDCFRVAVGTPEQTEAFIAALREVVQEGDVAR